MTSAVVISQAEMLRHIWRDPSVVVSKEQHASHYEVSFSKSRITFQVRVAESTKEVNGSNEETHCH
jgi:hypothetical protein